MQLVRLSMAVVALLGFGMAAATLTREQQPYPPVRFYQYEDGIEIEHIVDVFTGRVQTVRRPRVDPHDVTAARTDTYPAPDGDSEAMRECPGDTSTCTVYLQRGDTRTSIAENAYDGYPTVVWSPDGAWLYVLVHPIEDQASPGLTLYRYDITEEALSPVFDGEVGYFRCDGTDAWCSFYERGEPGTYLLYSLNTATGDVVRVTDDLGIYWYKRWIEGAPALLYQRNTPDADEIVRYHAPTGRQEVVFSITDWDVTVFRFANDDDRWLGVRTQFDSSRATALYMVDLYADPPQDRRVYAGTGSSESLWWAPGGARAVFTAGDEKQSNLYSVTPEGAPVQLTDFENASLIRHDYTEDGQWLVAMVGFYNRGIFHTDAKLYRVRVDGSEPTVQVPLPFEWDFSDWSAWFTW